MTATQTVTMNSIHSVHALVRLLKSSTDPPCSPGLSKIEIACLAWSDPSFRAANKGEVVGEWLLTQLGQAKRTRRERDAKSTSDPIADSRYWTLLCSVLTTPPPTNARAIKTWLLPLLNRVQLDTLVIELLSFHSSQVLAPARAALAVLWPLAEKRISIDALRECLSAVFDACAVWEHVDDDLGWICSTVVGAYRNSLANAGNKKKLYSSFLTTHLPSWLCAICTGPSLVSPLITKLLQDSIYAAGADTLFSLDALKQPLDALFDALSSLSSISSLLLVLPKLFASFLGATHKHKSALFVTATSAIDAKEEVKKKGMEFVERCWTLIQGSASLREDLNAEKWRSVIGVLEIIEKERLFNTYPIRGMHIDGTNAKHTGELALSEVRDKAIEMLENTGVSSENYRVEQAVLSMELLDVLVRIDYDFIESILERVLSALINVPPAILHLGTTPSLELLIHVLEYHTKTRTVHTYALALLGAVFTSSASSTSWVASSQSVTCTFPLAYHLPALGCALRTSLTSTQIAPLAIAVLEAAESAWRAVKDTDRERTTKKRNGTGDADERERRMVQAPAQAFSFTSRVAGTVLSNLPPNAFTGDGEYSLESLYDDAGKLGWTVVWGCLRERIGMGGKRKVKGGSGKKRKHAVATGPLSAHDLHTMTSAALRFLYDVRARVSLPLGDHDRLEEPDVETLLKVAQDEESEPELVLEIIRTLFWHMWHTHNCESQKKTEAQPIFTAILDILTTCISSKSRWSGVSADLTRDNLGLAILYVLTDRWIDVLDALAPTECLERLTTLLLAVSLDLPDEDVRENSNEGYLQRDHALITLRGILLKHLRNAQFWELHNIRAVFLSSVMNLTTPLSSYSFPAVGVKSPVPTAMARTGLILACNVYRVLCYVPLEYFTRPVRAELIKRAIAGDIQICAVLAGTESQRSKVKIKGTVEGDTELQNKSPTEESDDMDQLEGLRSWSRRLTFVRAFLQRMGQFLNPANHMTPSAFVIHLLSPLCISFPSKALVGVTVDLIQLHVVNLLRSQESEAMTSISSVIAAVITAEPFSHLSSPEAWTQLIVQSTVLKLIERLISDFDPASLPDEVKHSLKTLLQTLESALSPHTQRSGGDAMEVNQFPSSERINAWSRTLSLARWLGIKSQSLSIPFGLKLAASLTRSENSIRLDSETCSSVLRLLFEELCCMPDVSHSDHIDVLVGFYAINGGYGGPDQVDTHIAQASKKLSVKDFSHLLDVLAEGIGGSELYVGQRERLIHLGKVILHDAPQGTLKVVQNYMTRCLNLFADREEIYGGPSSLKMQHLEFIARHCSDRPVAVRSADLGNIWSLLNKVLSGSSEHDATTMFPIFHYIVSIIGALIRLRRDLVVHTLPHLSLALRQLIALTRKIRPQLGAKQNKIVTDTFPSWLSASQPLSTDEARALARLLTSLTIKTVPRVYAYAYPSTPTESPKAESLAKPFAKHASYVLVAYVGAFNDPLCIMSAEMRRELEPGLFALCEMVGEHSRDALMVSMLDSGGKTIMKSLWKDYEKQRYVGKG